MKISGIICEYNPLHNGHLYHLEQVRRGGAEGIVAVMSGNFVQRGDFAVLDKYARAEMAVRCGADLVVELPLAAALSSVGIEAQMGGSAFSKALIKMEVASATGGDALEDFGKVGSGLSKITDNGFDIIKLDKSLVQPCLDRENKKAGIILESLIGMIRQLGIEIAAEGVETEEMANELIADGVNYLQGYYYSRPLSEGKFLEFIKQHNMKGT